MTRVPETSMYEQLFSHAARRVANQTSILVDLPNEKPDTISLAFGDADPSIFPAHQITSSVAGLLSENVDAVMNYAPADARLHALVTKRLEARGVAVDPAQLMITYGSSQVLGLLPQILIEPGDTIIVEGPTFLGAVEYFAASEARIETIPVGPNGMDIDALASCLADLKHRNIRPKFIYTIPTFQNPTGTLMPASARARLVALAAEYGVLVVEDDAYGDLHFKPHTAPSMLTLPGNEWVLHIGTFSKILAPGVRMAWAYGPPAVMKRLRVFKSESDCGTFVTRLVSHMAQDGWLERHIQMLRLHYATKSAAMVQAIAEHFPVDVRTNVPEGGFFVYGYLPQDLPAVALNDIAIRHGASFLPGTTGYANGQGTHEMRIAFSFQTIPNLVKGIASIGAAMREMRQKSS